MSDWEIRQSTLGFLEQLDGGCVELRDVVQKRLSGGVRVRVPLTLSVGTLMLNVGPPEPQGEVPKDYRPRPSGTLDTPPSTYE